MRVVLSNNQYSMLKQFAGDGTEMTEEEVGALVQTTFGSMLRNKWVAWNGGRFVIAVKGREALRDFEQADLFRKVASLKLTKYWVRPGTRLKRVS